MNDNYRGCPKCKKKSHINAGDSCPFCRSSLIVPKPKIKLPHSFPSQKINKMIWIDYNDADGTSSERNVDLQSIYRKNGTTYIAGVCRLRSDTRTFRVDRISTAADAQTGEVIDDIASYLLPGGADGGESPSALLPILGIIGSVALFIKAISQLVIVGILSWMMYSCFWAGGS